MIIATFLGMKFVFFMFLFTTSYLCIYMYIYILQLYNKIIRWFIYGNFIAKLLRRNKYLCFMFVECYVNIANCKYIFNR